MITPFFFFLMIIYVINMTEISKNLMVRSRTLKLNLN